MLFRFILSAVLLSNVLPVQSARTMPKRGLLLERLDEQNIKKHERDIARKILYSRAFKGALIGSALLAVGICSGISYKNKPKKQSETKNVETPQNGSQSPAAPHIPVDIDEQMLELLGRISQHTSELKRAEGADWYREILFKWDDFTQAIRISMLMLGASFVAPSVLKWLGLHEEAKAQLPDSAYNKVQSFSKKMLKIHKLQATLQYYANQLVGAQGESRLYFEKGLVSTCNHLNKQLEALLGYMNYRVKLKTELKPQIACEELQVVTYLKETTNEFYCQAENIINEDIDTQKNLSEELQHKIEKFCCMLQQEIGHFALLENL